MAPRLTWVKEPNLPGLSGVGQFAGRERGWRLHFGGDYVGGVDQLDRRYHRVDPARSWCWTARRDGPKDPITGVRPVIVPLRNTFCDAPPTMYATVDEAKAACREYVAGHLATGKAGTKT